MQVCFTPSRLNGTHFWIFEGTLGSAPTSSHVPSVENSLLSTVPDVSGTVTRMYLPLIHVP
jgi:hypothetical protein